MVIKLKAVIHIPAKITSHTTGKWKTDFPEHLHKCKFFYFLYVFFLFFLTFLFFNSSFSPFLHKYLIGASASASVLPMNTQDWSHWECTSWISLQSQGLSRAISNTTSLIIWGMGAILGIVAKNGVRVWGTDSFLLEQRTLKDRK